MVVMLRNLCSRWRTFIISSAVYVPQAMYEGEYLYKTIPSMAAAYAYHVCQKYALLHGNKRVALAAALVFLELNACRFSPSEENLYITMMEVAKGELNKESLTGFFERYAENKNM